MQQCQDIDYEKWAGPSRRHVILTTCSISLVIDDIKRESFPFNSSALNK